MAAANGDPWLVLAPGGAQSQPADLTLFENLLELTDGRSSLLERDIELKPVSVQLSGNAQLASDMASELALARFVFADLTNAPPDLCYLLGALDLIAGCTILPVHSGPPPGALSDIFRGRLIDCGDLARAREQLRRVFDGVSAKDDSYRSLFLRRLGKLSVKREPTAKQRTTNEQPPPLLWRVPLASGGDAPTKIGLWWGDIRDLTPEDKIDALVNSENTFFEMARMHDRGLSAVIRSMGARWTNNNTECDDVIYRELIERAERLQPKRPWRPGTTIITGSGKLKKDIGIGVLVHVAAAAPAPPKTTLAGKEIKAGLGYEPVKEIELCVMNALKAIWARPDFRLKKKPKSVLFPLIGTGNAGGDPRIIAPRIIDSVVDFVQGNPNPGVGRVLILTYSDIDFEACKEALDELRDSAIPESQEQTR